MSPDKLRFDYKTRRAPTPAELRQIEDLVNRRIVENHPVRPFVTTREYAAEIGALAFFEEKYGEFVRVLEIDEFSRELCGGTHVSSTSQIGLCKITASTSVGANTRRIGSHHVGRRYRALPRLSRRASRFWRQSSAVRPDRVASAVAKLRAEIDESPGQGQVARRWGRARQGRSDPVGVASPVRDPSRCRQPSDRRRERAPRACRPGTRASARRRGDPRVAVR